MSHNSRTEATKQAVVADAASTDTSLQPLVLASPRLPLELLDLIIRNVTDARSLSCLALASRLFAALSRSYRLGLLILRSDVDCYKYMAFCKATAPDAPSLVRELLLDQFRFLDTEKQFPRTKIFPLATDVHSLTLDQNDESALIVPRLICTARIHTLTLCDEYFTTMAEMAAFLKSMPSLRTVVLKYEVHIVGGLGAPSRVAINEAPEISELHLTNLSYGANFLEHVIAHATPFSLRNLKRLYIHRIDNRLEKFLSKVFQSPGEMEELVITRPQRLFGYLGPDHSMDSYARKKMMKYQRMGKRFFSGPLVSTKRRWAPNDDPQEPLGMFGSMSASPSQSASFPPGLRLNLLQFDLITGASHFNRDDNAFYSAADPTSTRPLRWLTSCFSRIHASLSVGTVKINISVDDGDVSDFVKDGLWSEWDAQLAKFEGGPPEVHIDVKSVAYEWEAEDTGEEEEEEEDKGEEEAPAIVAICEEALHDLRQCIERNMVHVREARGLRIL